MTKTRIMLTLAVGLPASLLEGGESPRITPTVRLIQRAEPAVVAIFSNQGDGRLGSGSGAIIHEDGYILTGDHVVRNYPGAVLLHDGRLLPYKTIGRLPEKDLALLKIDAKGPLARIPIGRSDDLMTGEPILVAGNPGGRGIVFSSGIVSSKAMFLGVNALVMTHFASDVRDKFIHFDAASNPGNSGGPLINAEGRQIGVVRGKYSEEENINFAIPIDRIRRRFASLVAAQERRGFWSGIEVDPVADRAVVTSVQGGSAADKAGMKTGDVLVKLDGKPVRNAIDWHLLLVARSPKDQIEIVRQRADALKTVSITLADYPLDDPVPKEKKAPGLRFAMYLGRYTTIPDFSKLKPVLQGVTDQFHASRVVKDREDDYALAFQGYLEVPKTGVYRLSIISDDGSRLFLHDKLVLDNDGPHPPQEISRIVRLAQGLHPVRVEYFEATGDAELQVLIEGERLPRQAIPPSILFRDE